MGVYGSSKSNVLAVMKETTPGTVVPPSGATDYVTLQPDFELVPGFEQLENEEIRASIGAAKPIQGLESPEGSFSHYLKHSGVEGAAPEMNYLCESAFGSTSSNATERVTDGSSTTSELSLATGGTDFARGKAVLIKDGVNGYQIRPVHSVSGDDLTLGFNVATAPGTGIGAGKCVNFAPANSGHPTLSIHSYRGNGQAYEILAGAQVSELTIEAEAGQFVNMNFAFQGTKYYFDPIRITSTNKYIDVDDGGGEINVSIEEKYYRDPHELAQALEDAINAASGFGDVATVTYLDNDVTNAGKFTIESDGGTFEILWNTGTNAANSIGTTLGFSVAADDTGATSYTSDSALSWAAPHTPSYDSTDPMAAKYMEVLLGDAADYLCFCAQSINISLANEVTDVLCICAESGVDQKKVTARAVTVQMSFLLDKHDADKFKRFRANEETRFAFNFGTKSGGNWEAGKSGCFYMPSAVISSYSLTDLDTLVGVDMELTGFVDSSGNGEVYLNFL